MVISRALKCHVTWPSTETERSVLVEVEWTPYQNNRASAGLSGVQARFPSRQQQPTSSCTRSKRRACAHSLHYVMRDVEALPTPRRITRTC